MIHLDKCLPLILLTACANNPTINPETCRTNGVGVPDGAPQTGVIVLAEFRTEWGVRDGCGKQLAGCARAVEGLWFPSATRRYAVFFSDWCAETHERCHALYEQRNHTDPGEWVVRCQQ